MNTKHLTIASIFALETLLIIVIAGCAFGGIDLVRDGTLNIDDQVCCQYAHLKNVVVEQRGENLLVSGAVHQNKHRRGLIIGHIHVEVISPDGETLKRVDTGLHRISRKSYEARFSANFALKVKPGSTVRVTFDHPFDQKDY
ncbi:MAG: hypothetical protein ABFS45_12310 [Pseudomonadota bacterium]